MEKDHERWLKTARKAGAKYIINVCDTFDYENYPVYVPADMDLEEAKKNYDGVNMQRIDAIVDVETGKII